MNEGMGLTEPPSLTLASKVTVARILGIPVFVLLMIYYTMGLKRGDANETYRMVATGLFLLIALTDALDGYLARSRKEITHLGKILDPLADKALLLSALIMMTRPSLPDLQPQFPVAYTLLVVSRDVILVAGAIIIHQLHGHVEVRPRLLGKMATALQMGTIVWALLAWDRDLFTMLVWAAGVFTFASGIWYLFDGLRQFEHGHPSGEAGP